MLLFTSDNGHHHTTINSDLDLSYLRVNQDLGTFGEHVDRVHIGIHLLWLRIH